jgi:hypothetical protein
MHSSPIERVRGDPASIDRTAGQRIRQLDRLVIALLALVREPELALRLIRA